MKYSNSNKPIVCMMTQSTCYRETYTMEVKGVLWHSTGVNNPTIRRYVQPDDNASNRSALLRLIGTNPNKNDWNHSYVDAGLNAWIGKLADGSIATVQTMPWNYRPWGCGSGFRGSCNSGWIQFEICEDGLNDKAYLDKVYKEACELTAYLCKMYNLDPYGTVTMNGVKVPVILCHADSNKLGLGSAHADVYHWFNKYGLSMETVRKDVAALLKGSGSVSTATRILSQGMSGSDVKEMQTKLIKLGYSCGSTGADGDFGAATKTALVKFQKDYKLDPDGYCGPLTQAALDKAIAAKSQPSSTKRVLSQGMSGSDVKAMQEQLIKLGYSCGSTGADGSFGAATKAALIKFQKDSKLEADGYCGPLTYAALDKAIAAKNAVKQIYRIRKTWKDAASQKGAYSNLDNAIAACKKLGNGYKVFDANGKIMYDSTARITPVVHTVTPINYKVQITTDVLRIRATPSLSGKVVGSVKKNEVYTIVGESNGWGKLKSGAGWISLAYTKKV